MLIRSQLSNHFVIELLDRYCHSWKLFCVQFTRLKRFLVNYKYPFSFVELVIDILKKSLTQNHLEADSISRKYSILNVITGDVGTFGDVDNPTGYTLSSKEQEVRRGVPIDILFVSSALPSKSALPKFVMERIFLGESGSLLKFMLSLNVVSLFIL